VYVSNGRMWLILISKELNSCSSSKFINNDYSILIIFIYILINILILSSSNFLYMIVSSKYKKWVKETRVGYFDQVILFFMSISSYWIGFLAVKSYTIFTVLFCIMTIRLKTHSQDYLEQFFNCINCYRLI
jgi:hypothetical protein